MFKKKKAPLFSNDYDFSDMLPDNKDVSGKANIYNSTGDLYRQITFRHYWVQDDKFFFEVKENDCFIVPANSCFMLHLKLDEKK